MRNQPCEPTAWKRTAQEESKRRCIGIGSRRVVVVVVAGRQIKAWDLRFDGRMDSPLARCEVANHFADYPPTQLPIQDS